MAPGILQVALDAPLDCTFDYLAPAENPEARVGQLVAVPFGSREAVGLVIGTASATALPEDRLRPANALRAQLPPLDDAWLALCRFAADYYQRPLGEVALPALPKGLRAAKTVALDRALKRLAMEQASGNPDGHATAGAPSLNEGQRQAVEAIAAADGFAPTLLHGVTGSGKTEVYLQAAARILADAAQRGEAAQVLILVPEINLTPQLEQGVRARFPGATVATLHSGLAEGERLRHWLAAHLGRAQIVLGTRLAVLASLPHLKLIVVDEEHDPSYKQQEGLRYSARDLAVWRAHQ
ncbi:MAG: DEAD/DEAH box helicase, partial [Burkholderiaceae bacterium]